MLKCLYVCVYAQLLMSIWVSMHKCLYVFVYVKLLTTICVSMHKCLYDCVYPCLLMSMLGVYAQVSLCLRLFTIAYLYLYVYA